MMMQKKMTKKTKIMKKNEDEDEFKESTPSEVFYITPSEVFENHFLSHPP